VLLEPVFRRPQAVVDHSPEFRARHVRENDDLCEIRARTPAERHRCFVRCTLEVPLLDGDGPTHWGLWAEISQTDFQRIWDLWSDPKQSDEPPMKATIANRIPGYPETVGLPVSLRLTGPTTRPALSFESDSSHPFAVECLGGVCTHRVIEWLETIR
jgi:hypothetical protein